MKKNLDFLFKNLIAHRGIFNNKTIPENSIPAFKNAIKKKFIIELDIHLLKDNTIVVFHDDNLKRLTKIDKKIIDYSYEELKKIKLLDTKYTIPKLDEVLNLVDGKVPIIVELKYDRKTGKLEQELVKLLDNYEGKFVVKSFNPNSIKWFKKNRPNYIRGLLVAYDYNKLKNHLLLKLFLILTKPDFLSESYKLYNDKRNIKIRKKYPTLVWTVRNKKIYNMIKGSFDNYICENIESEIYD